MKNVKTAIFVALIFICLGGSCSRRPATESIGFSFDTIMNLSGFPIKINEVINPVNIVQSDDYIIILTEPRPNADLFYVYDKNDFRFLYSFGKYGRGPNEFFMPVLIEHGPINNFLVR